jgi:hypothetical protein
MGIILRKNMKGNSHFHEPNAIKRQRRETKPKDGAGDNWDFRCPTYDQRSSNFVNAGTYYGPCMRQPVGHTGNPKVRVPTLPYGRIATMDTDEIA